MVAKCPVCPAGTLSDHAPEPKLSAKKCNECTGIWIGALNYEGWLKEHGDTLPEKAPDATLTIQSGEKPGAKFCPECKYILMKYKVGHDIEFTLNRCGQCAGVWFDKNEWDILKARNLHDEVHLIFSQPWQAAIRAEEHEAAMEKIWRDQIGPSDLSEIRRIKNWLAKHPKSAELYAFLLAGRSEKPTERATVGAATSVES